MNTPLTEATAGIGPADGSLMTTVVIVLVLMRVHFILKERKHAY